MSPVSLREHVESVPRSASALRLTTVFAVRDQRRRRSDLYPQRVVAYMSLDFIRGEPSGKSWGGHVWQAPRLLTAKAFMAEHLTKLEPCEK